jgi:hypothetical protein
MLSCASEGTNDTKAKERTKTKNMGGTGYKGTHSYQLQGKTVFKAVFLTWISLD